MTSKIGQPFWSADVRLSDSDWDQLEKAAGVPFSREARARIEGAATQYREDKDGFGAAVRPSAIAKPLKAVARAADALVRALDQMDTGRDLNHSPAGRWLRNRIAITRKVLPNLGAQRDSIAALAQDARAAAMALPQEAAGREGDPFLPRLILAARKEYRTAGGRGAYTGPALEFLEQICRLAGAQLHSAEAFKKAITRSLGQKVSKPR